MASLDTLQPAIARIQGAIRQLANGDPEPYKACWSQAADVTIYGGWGAYERGWAQVLPDPDEPIVHIYAEGDDKETSAELEQELRELVEEVLQQGEEVPA